MKFRTSMVLIAILSLGGIVFIGFFIFLAKDIQLNKDIIQYVSTYMTTGVHNTKTLNNLEKQVQKQFTNETNVAGESDYNESIQNNMHVPQDTIDQEVFDTKPSDNDNKDVDNKPVEITDVLLDVPFTSQAPLGEWGESTFQDGCEEASIYMAMLWVEKRLTTNQQARAEIISLAEFQRKNYGSSVDTDTTDTIKLIQDYYGYMHAEAHTNISAEDIKQELARGNLVLAPANGRKLGNPNYTAPGPLQHFLVIKGWDTKTGQFITNDPGTRNGENYRYAENVLTNALREYPTGNHDPITDESKKSMIVIKPLVQD